MLRTHAGNSRNAIVSCLRKHHICRTPKHRRGNRAGLNPKEPIMSVYKSNSSRPIPLGAVGIFSVVSGAEALARQVGDWRARRSTRAALRRLSSAQLQDIGLTRTDLSSL